MPWALMRGLPQRGAFIADLVLFRWSNFRMLSADLESVMTHIRSIRVALFDT